MARAHKNIVVVALANKLARIAWAVLRATAAPRAPAAQRRPEEISCRANSDAGGSPKSAGGERKMA